jgi:hypothetical protein
MADKSPMLQQPVISIRISDELRLRLETLKEIMAAKSGEPVSTSEAAKQLLESSKEERLEFVNLLSEPTDSLVKIRGKVDAKLPLSQAEWTLVAYYCQQGAELFANTGQTEVSFESLAGILELYPNREREVRWPLISSPICPLKGKLRRSLQKRLQTTMYDGPSTEQFTL